MFVHVGPEQSLHAVHLVLLEQRVGRLGEPDDGQAAPVVPEHEERLPVRVLGVVPVGDTERDVLQSKPAVLLVVNRSRGIKEVNSPGSGMSVSLLLCEADLREEVYTMCFELSIHTASVIHPGSEAATSRSESGSVSISI